MLDIGRITLGLLGARGDVSGGVADLRSGAGGDVATSGRLVSMRSGAGGDVATSVRDRIADGAAAAWGPGFDIDAGRSS